MAKFRCRKRPICGQDVGQTHFIFFLGAWHVSAAVGRGSQVCSVWVPSRGMWVTSWESLSALSSTCGSGEWLPRWPEKPDIQNGRAVDQPRSLSDQMEQSCPYQEHPPWTIPRGRDNQLCFNHYTIRVYDLSHPIPCSWIQKCEWQFGEWGLSQ